MIKALITTVGEKGNLHVFLMKTFKQGSDHSVSAVVLHDHRKPKHLHQANVILCSFCCQVVTQNNFSVLLRGLSKVET